MKSGFVSIIGRPNVGKSSLLNKILQYKVSITSSTPQTTRDQIKNKGAVALITKLDKSNMDQVKEKAEELKAIGFKDVLGVSVEMQDSINHLIEYLKENLNEGLPFYDREELTDMSMRFIAKEIIRESAIENTREEVPHSLAVEITEFKEPTEETPLTSIHATIFVERESQKGILVGRQGSMIKKIGTSARMKLEESTGEKIFLNLKVKVNKDWTEDEKQIKKMGY